jgi:hypothetical protein
VTLKVFYAIVEVVLWNFICVAIYHGEFAIAALLAILIEVRTIRVDGVKP